MLYVIEGMERWRKREREKVERERGGGWVREWKDRDACNFSEVVTVTNPADSMYVVYLCPNQITHTPLIPFAAANQKRHHTVPLLEGHKQDTYPKRVFHVFTYPHYTCLIYTRFA